MPDRPIADDDFIGKLNDALRRLRDAERVLIPNQLQDELATFGNGSPLGTTTSIDFGPGLHASLVGDRRVRVTSSGGESGWDAIVDSTLSASEPGNRLFMGIGEALTYLGVTLGLATAAVLIRAGTYVETANWTSPGTIVLFGAVGRPSDVTWRTQTFSNLTTGSRTVVYNMSFESTGGADKLGHEIEAYNCRFVNVGLGGSYRWVSDYCYVTNCIIDGMMTGAAIVCSMTQCDILQRGQTTALAQSFTGIGLRLGGGSGDVWNVGSKGAHIQIETVVNTRISSGASGIFTIGGADSAGTKYLYLRTEQGGSGIDVTLTGTLWHEVTLEGGYRFVTVPECHFLFVQAAANRFDLTGPGTIDLVDLAGSSGVTLRGDTISGNIVTDAHTTSSATIVKFVGARYHTVSLSGDGGGTSGTATFFSLDAASTRNTIVQAGASTFPIAWVDSGTNNRILPEAAPPSGGIAPANADYLVGTAHADLSAEIVVGTAPGGELGGTWASPTVDTTHSGSRHPVFGNVSGPASYATGGFVLDLSATFPAALSALMLQLEVEDADLPPHQLVVTRDSPSAGQATIKVMRVRYDKATAVGNVSGQPAGVTVQGASGATTATEAAHTHSVDVPAFTGTSGAGQSAAIAPVAGVNVSAADDATHTHAIDHDHASFASAAGSGHDHVDDNIYEHQHDLTDTQTDAAYVELAAGTDISTAVWRYLATGS